MENWQTFHMYMMKYIKFCLYYTNFYETKRWYGNMVTILVCYST